MFSFKQDLQQRVQQIADLSRKDIVDVIVQLKGAGIAAGLRKAMTASLSHRRASLTPREVISATMMKSRRSSKRSKKNRTSGISAFKRRVAEEMQPALRSQHTRNSMERLISEATRKLSGADSPRRPQQRASFWTSRSMLMRLTKSELQSLPGDVQNIRDIRPNRKLSVPIIKQSQPLTAEAENRLSTTWGLAKTNAYGAWGVYGAEGQGTTVAVLDTGVDATHPDLAGKVRHWAEFDAMGNIIDTTNPHDTDKHGTHVAGTIAGGNTSGRWIGMAPLAEIAAAMVLDGDAGGTDAQVLAGMDWAIEKGVDVINMSLGGLVMDAETPPTYSEAIVTAILAGIPVVCAIGNEGEQTSGLPGSDLFATSVGATDADDRAAGFSGGRTQIIYDSDFVNPDILPFPYIKPDLSAPGVAILSSVPGGGWEAFSGTSMATPHVSGAISLLLSATNVREMTTGHDRYLTILDLITGTVDDIGESGQDSRFGFGRLDALRAIDFAVRDGFGR